MLKVFLSNINSPLGQSIYEEIRTDHLDLQPPQHIVATLDTTDGTSSPEGQFQLLTVTST